MALRRFTEADAGPLAALYGDPRVMRFITLQPPSLAEVESTILPAYLREYRELADGLGSFAAIEKATGQMAGRFSLKPASSYGLAGGTELGYRLYPSRPRWPTTPARGGCWRSAGCAGSRRSTTQTLT
jgi:RimJ/RimL family protein N-acetyltransferase